MMGNCLLSDLIDLSRDGEWGESEPFDGCVRMAAIRGTDFDAVRQGDVALVPIRFIKEHIAEYKVLHGGEILIEAAGGSKGRITGRTIYLKPETVSRFGIPVTCASFSRFIRLKQSELWDTRYVFWQLQYLYHFGFMDKYNTQHTGVSRFQWTVFAKNEPLFLPPLPSQRKIAAILSAYDDLIENNLRRIKILEEMAQNLYRERFVKFRFPGHQHARFTDSPLGRIPEGWEAVPLSSVVDFAKGRKPVETRNEPIAGDVRLLLIDALRGGEPQFTAPTRLVIAETRDTIMVMDGGSSCAVVQGFSGAVGSTLGRFRTTKPGRFSPHALYRFLEEKTDGFKSKNIGAAIPHANKDYILTQMIPLPPPTIALDFTTMLEPIQSTIEILKAKNTTLRRTRDLLLPKLISGEVDVSELDIAVSEESSA